METIVIVKIRINQTWAKRLIDRGVKSIYRDKAAEKAIIEKHAKEAEELKLNPYRYDRIDQKGTYQADSGKKILDGNKAGPLDISHLDKDVQDVLGVNLVDVFLTRKKDDRMSTLWFIYSTKPAATIIPHVKEILNTICSKVYLYTWIWANPDNTVTINISHAVDKSTANKETGEVREERDLRLKVEGGSFKAVFVKKQAVVT